MSSGPWFLAVLEPPADSRCVIMRFDHDGSRDAEGFYWRAEHAWYRSDGSKKRSNAVHPVMWSEKPATTPPPSDNEAKGE